MLRFICFAISLAVINVAAQDPNCDFVQNVEVGRTYAVRNLGYPGNYSPGAQCRWIGVCPAGYNCRLDCSLIQLPDTPSCSMDRFLVSKSGDPQLTAADYYCGQGTLSAVSTGQRISVGLISANNSPGGRFSCQLYAQAAAGGGGCSCGYKKLNRIVGGQETGVNEFPMMVGLADTRINQIKCGGVIISNRYILTAAHCLEGQNVNTLAVVVGEHDVTTGADSSAMAVYRMAGYLVHPQFTSSNYDYDIAIVAVDGNIQFSDRVGPVCLPFKFVNSALTGAKLTTLGWGTIFPGGPTSPVLRKVDVDVMSQSTCQARVPQLTPRQICTYTPGKDACQDDSGGPLLYTDPSTGLLFNIGIVSYGRFCASANQPGVNTRVPALLNWIVANTPDANYCRK